MTCSVVRRLAYKSSSKSAKRDRAPCLEARSAIVRARASERVARASVPGPFNEKRVSDFEKVYVARLTCTNECWEQEVAELWVNLSLLNYKTNKTQMQATK